MSGKLLLLVLTLLCVSSGQNIFCSAYCGFDQCSGPTGNDCLGCDEPFILQGSECQIDPSSGFTLASNTSSITINETGTSSCSADYTYQGDFN